MNDGRNNAPIYSCPDCGWDIEMPMPEVTSNDRDAYYSATTPPCERPNSGRGRVGRPMVIGRRRN